MVPVIGRLLPPSPMLPTGHGLRGFSCLSSSILKLGNNDETPSTNPFQIAVRNITRVHFPRPSEVKRIRRHGWKKRMSTPEGRKIIMKRILKGTYILTH